MYHDLPRTARFWSFLLAVDQDLAEKPARKHVPAAAACTAANYPRKPTRHSCASCPRHSASD